MFFGITELPAISMRQPL